MQSIQHLTMAGIYIHIPFCKTRCIYCDFFTQTDPAEKKAYTDAVCKELETRKTYLGGEVINTIYFGGGTPSQLESIDLKKILKEINRIYTVVHNAEITIEANPDDIGKDFIDSIYLLGFNRISIGVQSFIDAELSFLGRRHNAEKAIAAVQLCKKAGFENISIDLMYGLPTQTIRTWEETLDRSLTLDIQHISSYHLIYEKGTELYKKLKKGLIKSKDDDESVAMYLLMNDKLKKAGFEHYEISNFVRNGLFSKHNSSYWTGDSYLGVGAAAHSYNGSERSWNVASIKDYIKGVSEENGIYSEREILSDKEKYNDFVLTRMRTMWGAKPQDISDLFGSKYYNYFLKNAEKHINSGNIVGKNDHLIIPEKAMILSDGIISDLIYIK